MKEASASRGTGPEFVAWLNDQETAQAVRNAAREANLPDDQVQLGGLRAALDYLEKNATPKSLLVDVSNCDDIFDVMNRLADACEPETRVIALGTVNDIETYRRLLAMGLTEYLVKPSTPEAIAGSLRRIRSSNGVRIQTPKRALGSVAVIGTRGGVGATSIAVSIACALAHQRKLSTVLIDLDLQLGSIAISLDLEPSRGLREILENPDRVDSLLLGSALTQESEHLRVLSAEEGLELNVKVGEHALKTLLDLLGQENNFIVMDVSRRLDILTRSALKEADAVCVITDLSLSGMRDSKRLLELCCGSRPGRPTLLVANRVGGIAGEVPQGEFERGAGVSFDFVIPDDGKAAAAAADQGSSLLGAAASGALKVELDRLVRRLAGVENEVVPQTKPSWIKRLVGS